MVDIHVSFSDIQRIVVAVSRCVGYLETDSKVTDLVVELENCTDLLISAVNEEMEGR
jgi:hypothetical protein